ncbi:MAG: hypothetical protein MI923_06570 [Phycisphaerales bacterium]|nr:hypothetical protein [Phycisphaerales bacterium]
MAIATRRSGFRTAIAGIKDNRRIGVLVALVGHGPRTDVRWGPTSGLRWANGIP